MEAVESLIEAAQTVADFTGESLYIGGLGEQVSDVLGFIARYSAYLTDWQRALVLLLHTESRYFWPQILTKITNEGFATFWHRRILRSMTLSSRETWETARFHAELIAATQAQLNPYALGLALLEEIERQGGLSAVLNLSQGYDDVGLIRTYLTESVGTRIGLAVYNNQDNRQISDRSWSDLKAQLLTDLERGGMPRIHVDRAHTEIKLGGILKLTHLHDGRDLDFAMLPKVLYQVSRMLWGGPVTLTTIRQKLPRVVTHNGIEWSEEILQTSVS